MLAAAWNQEVQGFGATKEGKVDGYTAFQLSHLVYRIRRIGLHTTPCKSYLATVSYAYARFLSISLTMNLCACTALGKVLVRLTKGPLITHGLQAKLRSRLCDLIYITRGEDYI